MRERFGADIDVLCQGEDQIADAGAPVRRATPHTCLFGTLSLWQGVDVPGSSCQLVIIDRIPFPRPDDPLTSARAAGGRADRAATASWRCRRPTPRCCSPRAPGRLIRRGDDRGVVAVPRLAAGDRALRRVPARSLPPFWPTTDRRWCSPPSSGWTRRRASRCRCTSPALRGTRRRPTRRWRRTAASTRARSPVRRPARPHPARRSPRGTRGPATRTPSSRRGSTSGSSLEELAAHLELPAELVQSRLSLLRLEVSAGARMSFD